MAKMHAGQTAVHDHVDDARQRDELVDGDDQRQQGKGHHGPADAAHAGDETAQDPGEENKKVRSFGHNLPSCGRCPAAGLSGAAASRMIWIAAPA